MVKDVDVTQMAITDFMIPRNISDARSNCKSAMQPADTLRKIVRRFVMANQINLNSELSYSRLVDALTAM